MSSYITRAKSASMIAMTAALICASSAQAQATSGATGQGGATPAGQPGEEDSAAVPAEITVTGSRISRSDYVAQSPIVTTSKDMIEKAGTPTVDNYIRQLPQFQPGAGDFNGGNLGTAAAPVGQATLNLRGLGSQRNLVLMDGRRLQPSNSQQVIDINTIPAIALQGVEVISGGASATYGSDAVAGVVNFKTREKFRGLEINAQTSVADRGDGSTQILSAVAGTSFGEKRGSVMVAGEYTHRDRVRAIDRPFFEVGSFSATIPQSNFVPSGTNLPSQAAVNSVFAGYGVAAGTVARTANLAFNDDGTLFRLNGPSINYRGSTTNPFLVRNGAAGYNSNYYGTLQVPLERINIFSKASYELSDAATLYAQGLYQHAVATSSAGEAVILAPWQLDVPVTNPFVPAALRTILASRPNPTARFTLNGRLFQAGPRSIRNTTNVYQILGGMKGDIPGTQLTYDVYGSYGKTSFTEQPVSGAASITALRRLIDAPDGGNALCAGGYNPFGLNPLSAACLQYVQSRPINRTGTSQTVVEGTVSGAVFDLPAGPLKFALTGSYRRNAYVFRPDVATVTNDVVGYNASNFTRGSVNVKEIAGELLIPILADVPLFRSLNASLGYRYSSYNLSGGVSTYKADLDWRVIEPLLLRGGYQRAVRAPNVGELFLAPSDAIATLGNPPSVGDPCDSRSSFRTGANAAQVRNLCIVSGVNAAIVDTFQQPNTSISGRTQGNTALNPETADTFTVGAVLQPRFLGPVFGRMSLSVDYYNIKIRDAIAVLGALTALRDCFNASGTNPNYDPANFFCSLFVRDPTSGLFTQARQPYLNLGGYKTSGIDTQFDWRIPTGDFGIGNTAVTLNSVVSYLANFKIKTLPTSAYQEYRGTIDSTQSYPRWKALTSVNLDIGALQIGGRWRYISGFKDTTLVTNPASTLPRTPAYSYFDLNLGVKVNRDFEFRGGITNLTDKQPPVISGTVALTNQGVYDVIGRTIFVGFKARL